MCGCCSPSALLVCGLLSSLAAQNILSAVTGRSSPLSLELFLLLAGGSGIRSGTPISAAQRLRSPPPTAAASDMLLREWMRGPASDCSGAAATGGSRGARARGGPGTRSGCTCKGGVTCVQWSVLCRRPSRCNSLRVSERAGRCDEFSNDSSSSAWQRAGMGMGEIKGQVGWLPPYSAPGCTASAWLAQQHHLTTPPCASACPLPACSVIYCPLLRAVQGYRIQLRPPSSSLLDFRCRERWPSSSRRSAACSTAAVALLTRRPASAGHAARG